MQEACTISAHTHIVTMSGKMIAYTIISVLNEHVADQIPDRTPIERPAKLEFGRCESQVVETETSTIIIMFIDHVEAPKCLFLDADNAPHLGHLTRTVTLTIARTIQYKIL